MEENYAQTKNPQAISEIYPYFTNCNESDCHFSYGAEFNL
jgi:hypothetical protein